MQVCAIALGRLFRSNAASREGGAVTNDVDLYQLLGYSRERDFVDAINRTHLLLTALSA